MMIEPPQTMVLNLLATAPISAKVLINRLVDAGYDADGSARVIRIMLAHGDLGLDREMNIAACLQCKVFIPDWDIDDESNHHNQ